MVAGAAAISDKKDLEQWFSAPPPTPTGCWKIWIYFKVGRAVRIMQEHWIGKSVGADVTLPYRAMRRDHCLTTRPDTLRVSFMVLAPEHPLVSELAGKSDHEQEILLCGKCHRESEIERTW